MTSLPTSRCLYSSRFVTVSGVIAVSFALAACNPQNTAPVAAANPTAAGPSAMVQPGDVAGTPVPPVAMQPAPTPQAATVPVQAPAPMRAPVTAPAPMVAAAPAPVVIEPQQRPAQQVAVPQRPVASAHMGEVLSIEPIRTHPQGSGAGALVGGLLGGVVGNQFGHGHGRVATTALGAVGGAVAGNHIERNRSEGVTGYRVSVRLDNGSSRTFQETHVGDLRVGDRVRVNGQSLRRV